MARNPRYPRVFGSPAAKAQSRAAFAAMGGSPKPTIAFASPTATVPEGNSGTTTVTNTVNVTRNGVAGALTINLSYGGTATGGVDYATAPVSVTIGAGQNSGSFDILVNGDTTVEPDETIVITASLSGYAGVTATKTITITNDDTAAPTSLLMGSRYNQPGFNGYPGSNGTDTNSNSRIGAYNETGAGVTKLRALFVNWLATSTNEQDGYNPITITAAVEYPAGTVTPLTFGGTASATLTASGSGNLIESDEAALAATIPAGALYWVRTYVSVAAGGRWPQAYQRFTGYPELGDACDFNTGIDKSASGTITNVGMTGYPETRAGYGPAAVRATGFTGAPVAKAFIAVGDSLVMGATDAQDSPSVGHGNAGYFAKACAGLYPVLNLGISGSSANNNLPANFSRRAALLAKIGTAATHIFCDWSVNDTSSARTPSQQSSDIAAIAAGFKSAIPSAKLIWATQAPSTTSSDGWKTASGQTVRTTPTGAFTGGSASIRGQVNAALRSGISGIDFVFDPTASVEVDSTNTLALNGGLWISGNGGVGATSTHLTTTGATSDASTSDGLHPTAFNSSPPGLGGIYILRDAVRAAFGAW